MQEIKESGSITEVEKSLFATMLRTAVGTGELKITRVRDFIPRELGGGGVKAFVSRRLTTHTPAVLKNDTNLEMHAQRDNSGTVALLLPIEF